MTGPRGVRAAPYRHTSCGCGGHSATEQVASSSAPWLVATFLRFRRLVESAERSADADQLAAASRQFGEALALWRGPPLSDIESDVLRRGEISMLAEQRLLTMERRIEIELTIGHHRQVIPQLRALVGEHPLRERY